MEYDLGLSIVLILSSLSVAVFSSIVLTKIRFPYTIGLVVVGIVVGLILTSADVFITRDLRLTPAIILYLILPTLIYDAAINMDLKALRMNITPILLLAVPGVLLSAGIIGGILNGFAVLGAATALLFGTLISATDPVAVIALFNEIGAPRRLSTLLDGESIFNDATAIVLFSIVLAAINTNVGSVEAVLFTTLLRFLRVLFGGVLIGSIVGTLGGVVVRYQRNHGILQISISLIMAYVSFIAADLMGVSGVMSTLAAGIVSSLLSYDVIEHDSHESLEHFWEFFSFVANSFVFLLLGLTEANSFADPAVLGRSLMLLLIVVPAVTIARGVVVFGIIPLYNLFVGTDAIPFRFQAVMFWGGLRGAVPVALVLAIPHTVPGRDILILITFGYILFTLLVQGTTVKTLMRRLDIKPDRSYFDYHSGVSYSLTFPTVRLLEIVTLRILETFKSEGFFVVTEEPGSGNAYLLQRGQTYLAVENSERDLRIVAADREYLAYGKQTIYETLLDLENSVSSLEMLVRSPEVNAIAVDETTGGKTSLNIGRYLNRKLIRISLNSSDKNGVIAELIDIAADNGAIRNRDEVLEAVHERERSMSTGFDNGIAIPHAKIDAADNIVLVVGTKPEGIDFDSLDGKPTRLFFLIISPKSQVGPHIQLLAEIGRKMGNADLREAIIHASDPNDIVSMLGKR